MSPWRKRRALMAWPFAKIVLKARVSGVAFALALHGMQGEF